jgi:hypothetical protein
VPALAWNLLEACRWSTALLPRFFRIDQPLTKPLLGIFRKESSMVRILEETRAGEVHYL